MADIEKKIDKISILANTNSVKIDELKEDVKSIKSMMNNGGCPAGKRLHDEVDRLAVLLKENDKQTREAKAWAVKAIISIPALASAIWALIKFLTR